MARKVMLQSEIRERLAALVDPAYRAQITRLVPTEAPLLGVRVPALRALAKQIAREHALGDDAAIALLHALAKRRCREELLLGVFIIAQRKSRIARVTWRDLDAWVDAIENWEVCDQLAMTIARERLDAVALDTLVRWVSSPNRWRRRFAIATVATAKLARHEVDRVLAPVANDKDPMVKKAVVWARRELEKRGG
jgi:3-methyladenine DNA glycosylase AlkD